MHSGKLNSTELDRLVHWVQFSFVLCIKPAMTGNGRCRFLTEKNWRQPSPVVAARRRFLSNDRHCCNWLIYDSMPRLWRTCDDRQFRRRFNAQREPELNWTVELSWVFRCVIVGLLWLYFCHPDYMCYLFSSSPKWPIYYVSTWTLNDLIVGLFSYFHLLSRTSNCWFASVAMFVSL